MRCQFCGGVGELVKRADGTCCAVGDPVVPAALSTKRKALYSIEDWYESCPPKGGARQWRDGYSAKESAKAWFRDDNLSMPIELTDLLESRPELAGFRFGTVTPEVCTRLDEYKQGRNADAIVSGVSGGRRTLIAVEAKASEDFGQEIGDRLLSAIAHTKVPSRIDALAEAVFGRRVTMVDPVLRGLRYQLLHALAGAVIEARNSKADQAVLAVHYFPNSRRPMKDTFGDFQRFVDTLAPDRQVTPGVAIRVRIHGSEFVPAEMPLFVGWASAPGGDARTTQGQ